MRGTLHDHLSVAAVYIPATGGAGVPVSVRLQTRATSSGTPAGFAGAAERIEVVPKIVLLTAEVPAPKKGDVISVAVGEAYQIGFTEPSNGDTTAVHVTRMRAADTAGLAVPA